MHLRRSLLVLLSLSGPAAASEPRLVTGLGFASFEQGPAGRRTDASGVALELRVDGRPTPTTGYDVTFTWGLTDWNRARQWIDAGNRAGSWTTEHFADVEAWYRRGKGTKDEGLRLLGA